MPISTKFGDQGKTWVWPGKKVAKTVEIIELIGNLDELQALIAIVKVKIKPAVLKKQLTAVQEQLYRIMADLARQKKLNSHQIDSWVKNLEKEEAGLEKKLNLKRRFIIPGRSEAESLLNYCRVQVRRSERKLCRYCRLNKNARKYRPYFNRLSDWFFLLSQQF